MHVDETVTSADLRPRLESFWETSGRKIARLCETWDRDAGSPVHTVQGRYRPRGWTEWTQGFMYGWAILQFDATDDPAFLELGREGTLRDMAPHVSHVGVHDHGFNIVSTYGNLRRLMLEGRYPHDAWQLRFYELAIKVSGAVQASRWQQTSDGEGYVYSFNGPHSLFCDTIRSMRALLLAHQLGHVLMGENDDAISLLGRAVSHLRSTSRYSVFYGEGRDIYDVPGRVAHESVFNTNDGRFRSSSTQQGYSGYSTWTRGLGWIMLGAAEQLEFVETIDAAELGPWGGGPALRDLLLRMATTTCDFYLANTPSDGVPYWDTGAPGLVEMEDHLDRPADPFNAFEPVDSSAAAIAAEALLLLGRYLDRQADPAGQRYRAAGRSILGRLLEEPYLSVDEDHEGLLLHGLYHRPRGWDHRPSGSAVPAGESVMWGDYHLVEAALIVQRELVGRPDYSYFGPRGESDG